MLKVECESCKAPYQIDERRVPPAGLKMRCPKCGHSFLVTAPGAAPPANPEPPRANPAKRTIVGMGGSVGGGLGAGAGQASPGPQAPPAATRTTVGVGAGVGPGARAGMGTGAPPPPAAAPASRASFPSDFPAALGSLEEEDLPVVSAGLPATKSPAQPPKPPPLPSVAKRGTTGPADVDLPIVAAGLPAPKAAMAKGPGPRPTRGYSVDLPAPAADLPVAKSSQGQGGEHADLPVVAAGLPIVAGPGLPVVAAGLPSVAASLPSVAASLPSVAASLPSVAGSLPVAARSRAGATRSFGEIDLPSVAEALPSVADALPSAFAAERPLPARPHQAQSPLDSFGEIELPREAPLVPSAPPPGYSQPPGQGPDFRGLELEERPRSHASGAPSPMMRADSAVAAGGVAYGEVDFGGGGGDAATGEASIGVDAMPTPSMELPAGPPVHAAATAPVPTPGTRASLRELPGESPRKRTFRGLGIAAAVAALAVGGAALQLTQYGAFGYLYLTDRLHAADYERATSLALLEAERAFASDTYDAARSAADAAAGAHQRTARARSLTAYAAFVDLATTVRFGPDAARVPRAKQLLGELPVKEPAKYADVAHAAELAAEGELDKSRKALDVAERVYAGDAIRNEVWLLRGAVELASRDGAAASVAFKHALDAVNDARAHFGLAQAFDVLGDGANAKKEIEATLAASPQHPGALTLRARMKSAPVDEAQALRDLATVLEGPARTKASPSELSNAYAARAWVSLDRGAASEAREAFAQAVKLNPRNVDALGGEGRLLLNEERYTEALARFDTALAADPNSPELIAGDADAKLGVERLADAKQQLLAAKQRFPKSIPILLVLGRVEQHLGNNDAAESDLHAALTLVDPSRRDAVLPYVELSELLSARGRLSEAKSTLDDAKKKLPASATLDRAFGEVAELQGDFDTAIADYKSAITKEERDVATHFRLAVTLRRVRKFEDAGAELDRVAVVDKDYPGLSLERGLLFEESGDVERAIDQFKSALAKAPNDPDLQLRVGSAYVAIGRPDDALPMLRKVLEKRPTSAEAQHYIGRALMLKGRAEQVDALRYLKRAVDLDPNRAEYHVYLAWEANEATPAQLELARDEIDKALALDKMSGEAYWQKGVLERMEGAIEDAIKDARHALELRPSRYEAHATLAECYEDKNDPSAAMGEWTRAIAGDGVVATPDGTVPHPYWRYRYGKLLLDRGNVSGALALLVPAVLASEKMDPRPGWLAPVEFLSAEALRKSGKGADAVEHYRRFLEIAPVNSPDRADAQAAIAQLGGKR